jgi:3-methyladenine DNA glycosylase AlkD
MNDRKTNAIILEIRKELAAHADQAFQEAQERYFKEQFIGYGVRTAVVNDIARRSFHMAEPLGKEALFSGAESLWQNRYNEEAIIACEWTYRLRRLYEPADFWRFAGWIEKYVDNWAKCDTFCNHSVGAFLERFPSFVVELRTWAISPNRWLRRASAVSLILPVRQGLFFEDALAIAGLLLQDRDDLVQKGYGWLLREAASQREEVVFAFVQENKAIMGRTALRYAIEKMPADLRSRAMAKDG